MSADDLDRCDLLCLDLPHAEEIRDGLPPRPDIERVAQQVRALAEPTRLTIATALHQGTELCVCDMAWVVGQSEKLVSHHLRILRTAGVATSQRQGKLVLYRLTGRGRHLVESVFATAPDRSHE